MVIMTRVLPAITGRVVPGEPGRAGPGSFYRRNPCHPRQGPSSVGALAGIRIGTGAAWFDYDRDGDLDLYMTNRVGANHLWRNDGGGIFVDVAAS